MNQLNEIVKIADIHAGRITYAMNRLQGLLPLTGDKVAHLSEQDFLSLELLTNRFSKLQDFMGSTLIDAFLAQKGELLNHMTMIDKINKLEKLAMISDAEQWIKMREVRNHLSHEYPEHPEITAKYLNQVIELTPQLLLLLENIKARI